MAHCTHKVHLILVDTVEDPKKIVHDRIAGPSRTPATVVAEVSIGRGITKI